MSNSTAPSPSGPGSINEGERIFYEVIYHVTEVLFGISVVSALFTIITFTLFPRIRTYPIKLIMFLCVTIVFGHSCFAISPWVTFTPACTPIGAAIHYFLLANFFWCFCIAFNFYQMIVKRNSATRSLEKYYHLIGWGTPCIAVIVVAAFFHYGETAPVNGSCYINQNMFVLGAFFLPGLVLTSANAVLFFFVASEIHGTLSKAPETEQREQTKEFRVLMSIFVTVGLSWIFGFLNSIFQDVPILNYIILILMTLFTPLQGFFIFVAYCLNKKVQHKWMNLFAKCFPCCAVKGAPSKGSKTGTTGTAHSTRGGGYSSTAHSRSTANSGRDSNISMHSMQSYGDSAAT